MTRSACQGRAPERPAGSGKPRHRRPVATGPPASAARHGSGPAAVLLPAGQGCATCGPRPHPRQKRFFIRRPCIEIRRPDGIAQTLHGTQAAVDHPGQPRPVELPGQIHGRMQHGVGRQTIQEQQAVGRHGQQPPQRQGQLSGCRSTLPSTKARRFSMRRVP